MASSAVVDGTSNVLVSFKTGAIAEMVALTLHLARTYFVFALIVGYVLEWAGRSPTADRDYAGCTWRAFIVLFLLVFYTDVFGSVINLSNAITQQVTPPSVAERLYDDYKTQLKATYARMNDTQARALLTPSGDAAKTADAEAQAASVDFVNTITGGLLMDSLVSLLAAIGLVVHWLVSRLALLLIALFYVIGPLALVFSIPSFSGTGTRWFSEFVAFCAWPIISGLLLRISVALGSHLIFGTAPGAIETLASSLLTTVSAIATPVLCSKIVGGGAKSAASHGLESARALASSGVDLGKRGLQLAKGSKGGSATDGETGGGASSARRTGPSRSTPSNQPGA
jgi:hypothetical protein